jgi:hypothetical protein
MSDDLKNDDDGIPAKYRQTHPEEAYRGKVPGEPYRARKENRKRVLPQSDRCIGVDDWSPFTGR